MTELVGVLLDGQDKLEYYRQEKFNLKKNLSVVVTNPQGMFFGYVKDLIVADEEKYDLACKRIERISSKEDYLAYKKNLKDATNALKKCRELVNKEKLNMNVIDAIYTLDRDQLIFHFIAESRIDFRNLARELASLYHTRIELRQIGVRDKAKKVGGIGSCGGELCCARFLKDFVSVSINMAKNQNIALNPTKINGACGRLLCCLKYEDETYKEARTNLPELGSKVKTEKGTGTVTSLDILNNRYKVDIPEVGVIEMEGNLCK